jgi:hypothetical protein
LLEEQRRHYNRPPAAGVAECPEQFALALLVAVDDPGIRPHDLRGEQMVTCEAVTAAENAQTASERDVGDSDGRTAAIWKGHGLLLARVGQPCAGTNSRDTGRRHRDRPQPSQVEHDPIGRRAAGEAVAAATRHDVQIDRRAKASVCVTSSADAQRTTRPRQEGAARLYRSTAAGDGLEAFPSINLVR